MPGRKEEDDVGGFENGEPVSDGGDGDADGIGESGFVENLTSMSGKEGDKFAKCCEIANVGDLAYIAF